MIQKTEEEITREWGDFRNATPAVSVRCLAYNHEKYIAQCLDSMLMQETIFPFQIVVHDDASTDNTAGIIREYEKKFPNIVVALYEEENLYKKNDGSLTRRVNEFCTGKYIACLEGDDFWTDKRKLQLQYEALESNPDCSVCTCLVKCCNEDGSPIEKEFPGKDLHLDSSGIIEQTRMASLICLQYPFHTSSYFIRREAIFLAIPGITEFFKRDVGSLLRATICGNLYYICQPMSMRRYGARDSWNARLKKAGTGGLCSLCYNDSFMFMAFDKATDGKYRDAVFTGLAKRLGWLSVHDREMAEEVRRQMVAHFGSREYRVLLHAEIQKYPSRERCKYWLLFNSRPLYYAALAIVRFSRELRAAGRR